MEKITFNELASAVDVRLLKDAWLRTLVRPLDGYWEAALIGRSVHWEIRRGGEQIGYCCLDDERRLLSFFLAETEPDGGAIFERLLEELDVSGAYVSTGDPAFLALCLDRQRRLAVHTWLYSARSRPKVELPAYPEARFRPARSAERDQFIQFYMKNNDNADEEAVEDLFENYNSYADQMIANEQLFGLFEGQVLLGLGELRRSKSQPPYADVGMIVDQAYRRRGVATYIMSLLREYCFEHGLRPIASTETGNVGSQKAIERAGLVSDYRILEVGF